MMSFVRFVSRKEKILCFNLMIKRMFDILSSSMMIIILIPLWIVIPIVIKLDSKGPVFF